MEIWKDIKGYEGVYQVSNLGNVKSLSREVKIGKNKRYIGEKVLTPIKRKDGYVCINFTHIKRKQYFVHRLVAETFFGVNSYLVVNHKDFNRSNNKLENLEFCSQKENIYHSCIGGRNGRLILNTETHIYYYTIKEAAETINKNEGYLYKRLTNEVKNNTNFIYA